MRPYAIFYAEENGRYVNEMSEPILFARLRARTRVTPESLHQKTRRRWATRAFSGSATCERACDTL